VSEGQQEGRYKSRVPTAGFIRAQVRGRQVGSRNVRLRPLSPTFLMPISTLSGPDVLPFAKSA
jgi:hypothetical protein